MKLITSIELTDQGAAKFNAWFARVARPGVDLTATAHEANWAFLDDATQGQTPDYELRGQYTVSGNPEIISLDAGDYTITTEDDEQ